LFGGDGPHVFGLAKSRDTNELENKLLQKERNKDIDEGI
jgi:hypothetical protein